MGDPPGRRLGQQLRKKIEEYIIIVGGPSNTFNGYCHYDSVLDDDVAEPAPADSSVAEVGRYIQGDPANTNVDEQTYTHDLYWANFIYSAVKLVEIGTVRPRPGDLLTFIVYLPPYQKRAQKDWEASPHNLLVHRHSPWVQGKDPYDPMVRMNSQQVMAPAPARRLPTRKSTQAVQPVGSPHEEKINHEILMRTTGERDPSGRKQPDGGFHKRPRSPTDYIDSILNISFRMIWGGRFGSHPPSPPAPPIPKVAVKLLLLRKVSDLYAYLGTGTWTGERYLHILETPDEEAIADMIPVDQASWHGIADLRGTKPHPLWANAPSVDRTKVKIRRLDYFGHSGDDDLFLEYGWGNKKGEVPVGEVLVPKSELDNHLTTNHFSANSYAQLWGCNLGAGFAPVLAKHVKTVKACRAFTTYDFVLTGPKVLPEPVDPANFPWEVITAP